MDDGQVLINIIIYMNKRRKVGTIIEEKCDGLDSKKAFLYLSLL